MNTPFDRASRADSKMPADEALSESRKSDLDATARHLNRILNEAQKKAAKQNAEAGCVPRYRFPKRGQTALDGGLLECALGQRPAGRKHRYESRRRVVARRGTDR